jgi:primase-polymerase (primpol)-like protein
MRARKALPKLPQMMAELRRFVRFSASKVPLCVGGGNASSTDPHTWATLVEATASDRGVGVGFVLTGDGIGVIDLDHCVTDGTVALWAQAILDENPATFTELSLSGTGLHVWGLFPAAPGRQIRDGERNIEIYSTGRYVALHQPLPGTRLELQPLVLPI